jgi:hypothetical protein
MNEGGRLRECVTAGDRGDDTETDDELDRGRCAHYPTFPLPLQDDISN